MQNYSKIGQIGMMEMLMVMIIIGIITGIGVYLYYNAFFKETKDRFGELGIQESNVLLGMVAKIPEVQCSIDARTENCIDTLKLVSFSNVIRENKGYYGSILGFRAVNIEVVYPDKNNKECNEDTYPDCGMFKVYENKMGNIADERKASALVSLYYPGDRSYKIGRLTLVDYKQG